MLRVRPIHFTSRLDQWEQLLSALGLVKTSIGRTGGSSTPAPDGLALHPVAAGQPDGGDGTTAFGVEVGDLAEFARRTNAAAEEAGQHPGGAHQGRPRRDLPRHRRGRFQLPRRHRPPHGAHGADADPALAVVGVWFTADAGRRRPDAAEHRAPGSGPPPDDDETADFTAKNGGVLMVRPAAGAARSGLGFEYAGDLGALRGAAQAAGRRSA